MALLEHNVDLRSEGYSLDCHVPTVGVTRVRRQRFEWLERKGKGT